jgi:hypothetical protein
MDQEFKNLREVVTFLKGQGWDVAQSSIYNHAQKKLIAKNRKGVYTERAVRQYARDYLKLKTSEMSEKKSGLFDKKTAIDIILKSELAKTAKHKREVREGRYVLRAEAELEFIGRWAMLESQLKAKMQLMAADVIVLVGGDEKKIEDFINFMIKQVDEVMNGCASMEEFELFLEKTED